MIKRLMWYVSGIATGIGGVLIIGKRVRRSVANFAPVKVVARATGSVRSSLTTLADALNDGRQTMRLREVEMKADRDGRRDVLDQGVSFAGLEPNDEILVDGEPVDASRVIVLRQVNSSAVKRSLARPRRGS